MLSDGVFAIAITLLAFNLHGPANWKTVGDIWRSLGPQLDAYSLSFVVISVYWLAHRRFFAMIVTVDAPVTVLNLVMLALVALVPAATEFVHGAGPLQPAMLIYSALVVAIGASVALIWGYAALVADLVDRTVSTPARWFLLVLMLTTPPLFLALVSVLHKFAGRRGAGGSGAVVPGRVADADVDPRPRAAAATAGRCIAAGDLTISFAGDGGIAALASMFHVKPQIPVNYGLRRGPRTATGGRAGPDFLKFTMSKTRRRLGRPVENPRD